MRPCVPCAFLGPDGRFLPVRRAASPSVTRGGRLGGSQALAVTGKAAVNIHLQSFVLLCFRFYLLIFRERKDKCESVGNIHQLPLVRPDWGPDPQPRRVPRPGTEPCDLGLCRTAWSPLGRPGQRSLCRLRVQEALVVSGPWGRWASLWREPPTSLQSSRQVCVLQLRPPGRRAAAPTAACWCRVTVADSPCRPVVGTPLLRAAGHVLAAPSSLRRCRAAARPSRRRAVSDRGAPGLSVLPAETPPRASCPPALVAPAVRVPCGWSLPRTGPGGASVGRRPRPAPPAPRSAVRGSSPRVSPAVGRGSVLWTFPESPVWMWRGAGLSGPQRKAPLAHGGAC